MARTDKIATRYAKAIYGLLQSEEKVRSLLGELEPLARTVAADASAKRVFSSRVLNEKQREELAEGLSRDLKLSEIARRILVVLANGNRLGHLPEIIQGLHLLLLVASDIVPLEVVAAVPLANEERQKVESRFSQILGRKVEATYRVDASLIGGLKVTAGSRTFDGSVAGWLSKFREQLISADR